MFLPADSQKCFCQFMKLFLAPVLLRFFSLTDKYILLLFFVTESNLYVDWKKLKKKMADLGVELGSKLSVNNYK